MCRAPLVGGKLKGGPRAQTIWGGRNERKCFRPDDQTPVFEVTIASQAGASAKILTLWRGGCATSSCSLQRVAAGRARPQHERGLRSPTRHPSARCRGGSPTGSPMADLSSTASPIISERKPGQKHTLHGCRTDLATGFGSSARTDSSSGRVILESPDGDAGFPGAMTADLRLPFAGTRDAQGRALAVSDRPDPSQSHPAQLFQPRRLADILDQRADAVRRL